MTRYTIRRILLLPAFRFGTLVGGFLLLLPGFGAGLLLWGVARALRLWLESWDRVSLAGLAEISFLNVLKLSDVLPVFQWLDDLGWLLVAGTTVGAFVLGGFLTGFLAMLGAAWYNLLASGGGGVVVLADALERER